MATASVQFVRQPPNAAHLLLGEDARPLQPQNQLVPRLAGKSVPQEHGQAPLVVAPHVTRHPDIAQRLGAVMLGGNRAPLELQVQIERYLAQIEMQDELRHAIGECDDVVALGELGLREVHVDLFAEFPVQAVNDAGVSRID